MSDLTPRARLVAVAGALSRVQCAEESLMVATNMATAALPPGHPLPDDVAEARRAVLVVRSKLDAVLRRLP